MDNQLENLSQRQIYSALRMLKESPTLLDPGTGSLCQECKHLVITECTAALPYLKRANVEGSELFVEDCPEFEESLRR